MVVLMGGASWLVWIAAAITLGLIALVVGMVAWAYGRRRSLTKKTSCGSSTVAGARRKPLNWRHLVSVRN